MRLCGAGLSWESPWVSEGENRAAATEGQPGDAVSSLCSWGSRNVLLPHALASLGRGGQADFVSGLVNVVSGAF